MQNIVELTKALAWPLVAAVLLISFWKPLHDVADELPGLVSSSEEVSIGGVSLHLQKSLFEHASAQQKDILDQLQPDEIGIVLTFAPGNVLCWPQSPAPDERRAYEGLARLGLLREATKEEAKEQASEGYACGYGLTTTDAFKGIRELLIGGVTDAIRSAAAAPRSRPATVVMQPAGPGDSPPSARK